MLQNVVKLYGNFLQLFNLRIFLKYLSLLKYLVLKVSVQLLSLLVQCLRDELLLSSLSCCCISFLNDFFLFQQGLFEVVFHSEVPFQCYHCWWGIVLVQDDLEVVHHFHHSFIRLQEDLKLFHFLLTQLFHYKTPLIVHFPSL